ncbi:MAG: hypothetical protein SOT46_00055 [Treponema sp.]|nr:hypothetical protein [Spirochaetia bacterium]MDY2838749.1 hypothetical protein [Treponema sp.]
MTNEEIKVEISKLNNKKKSIHKNMSICGVLLIFFLYDLKKFIESNPRIILTIIYSIITVTPVVILILDYLQIRKIKNKIKELELNYSLEEDKENSLTEDN